MGQQQGKQGVAAPPEPAPPSIIDASVNKAAPVSRIKGLKPRQSSKESGAWSPALTGGVALGAGPPSGTMLGMFNELSNGKERFPSSFMFITRHRLSNPDEDYDFLFNGLVNKSMRYNAFFSI